MIGLIPVYTGHDRNHRPARSILEPPNGPDDQRQRRHDAGNATHCRQLVRAAVGLAQHEVEPTACRGTLTLGINPPQPDRREYIVPGLMGVVLTLTMILITGLAITRERERGTMENLLSMPTRPFEVLLGKIVPYILVGYVQVGLILTAARLLFHVPMMGNLGLLLMVTLVFIAANLAVGITFSTVARNQLQAMQMTFFFFLPSMLLSGFMFPFRGMPGWAQVLGEVLPLTHFLRIIRGILLKGNGLENVGPELWPIALFAAVALTVAVMRYRQTLD
jgi:ABC-2 type transport system permease protein